MSYTAKSKLKKLNSLTLSRVQFFVVPWTISRQGPLSMGFPRQEYWHGFPFPTPEGFPDREIEPESLMSSALAGRFLTISATWEAQKTVGIYSSTMSFIIFVIIVLYPH